MIIDGVEYIKKSEIISVKNMFITDPTNCMAIVPFERNQDIVKNNMIEVADMGTFKLFEDNIIFKDSSEKPMNIEKFYLEESCFSYYFFKRAEKMAKDFGFTQKVEFYKRYDKEKNKFVKDNPCIIKFGDLVFLLAPRIENE